MRRCILAGVALCVGAASLGADQITVTVRDRLSDAPLSGAYVQVGPEPGTPWEENFGFTDAAGALTLADAALVPGLALTAAPAGYARLTVLACPTGEMTLLCDPAGASSWSDTALVTGVVRGLPIATGDGNLDLGVVMGAVAPEALLRGGAAMLVSGVMDTMHVGYPANVDVLVPENIDIPSQIELLVVNFFKEPYTQRFPTGRVVDMICLGYRVNVWDLIAGEPQAIHATKATANRDYTVAGDAVVNHTCTVSFVHGVQVSVTGLPAGSEGYVASLGELTASPRRERFVPLHGAQCRAGVDTTVSLSYLPGTAPFADLVAYAGVAFADTSPQPSWGGGAFDWTPLSPGAARVFDRFYLPPDLMRTGDTFAFGGYQAPGTPSADWAISSFTLEDRAGAAVDSLVWEVVGPASVASFSVPVLGGEAPGWASLPDPAQTPGNDGLVWACAVVFAPGVALQEFLDSRLLGAKLFAFRSGDAPPVGTPAWVTIEATSQNDLLLNWAPDPAASAYVVRWHAAPWAPAIGQNTVQGTSYADVGALPSGGSARFYTLRSCVGLSESLPTQPVGGVSWILDDGP